MDYFEIEKQPKRSKYGNKITEYAGRKYDSKKEANHAALLDQLRHAVDPKEKVIEWIPQVKYPIEINGVLVCSYVADFVVTYGDGRIEVQDVKSSKTSRLPTYRLKKKLMRAVHYIEIVEI